MKRFWPKIRQVKLPDPGAICWQVDGRFRQEGRAYGRRHLCETESAARELARQLKIQRANDGSRIFEFSPSDQVELTAAREKLAEFAAPGETLAEALSDLGRARALLAGSGKTVFAASEFFAAHLESLRGATQRTVSEVIAELRQRMEVEGISYFYRNELRYRLGAFEEDFGPRSISEVSTAEIDCWLSGLRVAQAGRPSFGRKVSALTRNNFRRVVARLFSFAVDRGYCSSNPVSKSMKSKVIAGPPGILSPGQARALLAVAGPEIRAYLAIGMFAGLRVTECERLTWSEIDLEESLLQVSAAKAKTGKRRFVRILPNLREWLLPVRRLAGPVVGLSVAKQRAALGSARAAAGIHAWPGNALRHSFASYHLGHFRNAAELALEMGHSDSGMVFAHYREVVKPSAAAEYWGIFPEGAARRKIVEFPAAS